MAAKTTPEFNEHGYTMSYDAEAKVLTVQIDLSESGDDLPVMSSTGKSVIVANSHSYQPVNTTHKVTFMAIRKPTIQDRAKLEAAAKGATNPGTVVP